MSIRNVFTTTKFIECVRQNPAIWDMDSELYIDRGCRETSWNRIGQMMYDNWVQMIDSDDKVEIMKKKWRHIRDAYGKYLNQCKQGGKKPRRYYYADALDFMRSSIESRRKNKFKKSKIFAGKLKNESNMDDSNMDPLGLYDESNEVSNDIIKEEDDMVYSTQVTSTPSSTNQLNPTSIRSNNQMVNITSLQTETIPLMENLPEDTLDADKAFMLSLLPDYKKLTYKQKIDFRLHALQFFSDINQS